METKKLIGARLKEIRRARNYSQEALAERVGINPKYLSSIERGKENPTLDMLIKLSGALDVELAEMFSIAHLGKSTKALYAMIAAMLKESEPQELQLAARIIKAIHV